MEILLLIVVVWATKGAWDHAKGARTASRDQRIAEVAKTYPKGALPKSRRKAAARQYAAGWWAREVRHGFPVTKTGWHAAWLAHQTTADHHKARREEARTTALETRASVLKGMPDHKKRQAEAQAELDKIRGELAVQQAKGSPATGRKAVREAADEVARKRAEKEQPSAGKCPACGAPDGYEHLEGCDPAAPPLPAESVRRTDPVVIDTPARLHNAEDSAHLLPGEPRCEGCGGTGRNGDGTDACPVCRGWGAAHVGPEFMGAAPAGTVCNACGRKGTPEDPVLIAPGGTRTHRSHAVQLHEAYADALKRHYPDDGEIDDAVTDADSAPIPFDPPTAQGAPPPDRPEPWWRGMTEEEYEAEFQRRKAAMSSPKPQNAGGTATPAISGNGAPMSGDANYTGVKDAATGQAAHAEHSAAEITRQRQEAEALAEHMQAVDVDAATLSAQMDHADQLRKAEQALLGVPESAQTVSTGLAQRHGGLHEAHQNAPVRAADRTFYED